jgi:hypothetical protein
MREILRPPAAFEVRELELPNTDRKRQTANNVFRSPYPDIWSVTITFNPKKSLTIGFVKHLETAFRLADAATFRFLDRIQFPLWCFSEEQAAIDAEIPEIRAHLDKIESGVDIRRVSISSNAGRIRKSRYGITQEDFALLFRKQTGKCAICRNDFTEFLRPKFDPDNNGILCRACHMGIKAFNNSTDQLSSAINYLN